MKSSRFPIPNLREASQMVQRFKDSPAFIVVPAQPKRKPETPACAEARRQRVEAITRQPPRVIITSNWTIALKLGE